MRWEWLESRIEPFYPKAYPSRRPYPLVWCSTVHDVRLFLQRKRPGVVD